MDKFINEIEGMLLRKGILCLCDLELNQNINHNDMLLDYLKNKLKYDVHKIGKKGIEKTYIIKSGNEIQIINTVNMMLTGLKNIKNDLLSNQIANNDIFKNSIIDYNEQLSDLMIFNNYLKSKSSSMQQSKITVKNYDDLKNEIDKFIGNNLKEMEYDNLFLRGNSRVEYDTVASIFRSKSFYDNEDIMHHELTTKKPFEFQNINSHLEILQIMQHYGLPTRLLDATKNLLVALYFACSSNERKDGEVLIYTPDKENIKNANSDTIEILCAIAGLRIYEKEELHRLIIKYRYGYLKKDDFNLNPIIKKLVHQIRKVTGDFECNIDPNDLLKAYFVIPTLKNERIIRQDGVFLINGLHFLDKNVEYKNIVESNANEFSKFQIKKNGIKQHFIIPSSSKQQIISELNLLGINQSTLFPEIDNVTNFIKTKYYK